MKSKWGMIVLGLVVLLLLIQFIPVPRTNPPATADLVAPPEVKAIFTNSCYDCHSHQTRWPLYSHVAPISWLIAHDVHNARARLNFSQWGTNPEDAQGFMKAGIYKMVSEGEMPPWDYLLMHRNARLTPDALKVLKEWCHAESDADTP